MMYDTYQELKEFVAEQISRLAYNNNISYRELSVMLGYEESYVNHIVNNHQNTSLKGLFDITKYFKVDFHHFFNKNIKNPDLITAINEECEKLSREDLQSVLYIIRKMAKQ